MSRAASRSVADTLSRGLVETPGGPYLDDGARVAVVGGGPAGSFFAYFLSRMARQVGLQVEIDIYEPRSFDRCGPAGCNHCGGIVSESLVQLLATEGINLPRTVMQRRIDSYVLHMDVGSVRIETPLREKRIAAVFRGNGPRDARYVEAEGFDGYLLGLAERGGATIVRRLVTGIDRHGERPRLHHAEGPGEPYDLVALASGINSRLAQILGASDATYRAPQAVTTYICELELGHDAVRECLGNSMHVFLLAAPRIEFAALVPKGPIVTLCMLGHDIDSDLVQSFVASDEVRRCLPDALRPLNRVCQCSPLINVRQPARPFADRLVALGDCGVTRLYKDGIGAAYRTAKSAAATAAFTGISAAAFEKQYWPTCRSIGIDNAIGRLVFAVNERMKKRRYTRRVILRMVAREQAREGGARRMSQVLWDLFTGSAPYREVLRNAVHPGFVGGLAWNMAMCLRPARTGRRESDVAWRAG